MKFIYCKRCNKQFIFNPKSPKKNFCCKSCYNQWWQKNTEKGRLSRRKHELKTKYKRYKRVQKWLAKHPNYMKEWIKKHPNYMKEYYKKRKDVNQCV